MSESENILEIENNLKLRDYCLRKLNRIFFSFLISYLLNESYLEDFEKRLEYSL